MTDLALESFIKFCDDMTIAEEGVGASIANGIEKIGDLIKICIDKIQSLIVGLKKKKTLYVPYNVIKAFNIAHDELREILNKYSDNIDTILESDSIPDEGSLQEEALENQKKKIIDIFNKASDVGKQKLISEDIKEVRAAIYVSVCQKWHKRLQDMYSLLGNARFTDNKTNTSHCMSYLRSYISAIKTQIYWIGIILKYDKPMK